jgi:hypothetical protein
VLRLIVLKAHPDWFSARVLTLDSVKQNYSIGFLGAGVAAWWISLRLGITKSVGRVIEELRRAAELDLRNSSLWLAPLCTAIILTDSAIAVLFGRSLVETSGAFLLRLLPAEIALYVLVAIGLSSWTRLTLVTRTTIAIGIVAFVLGGMATGTRGSLFSPVVAVIVSLVVIRGDPRVRMTRAVLLGSAALVLLGPALSLVVQIRGATRQERMSVVEVMSNPLGTGLGDRKSLGASDAVEMISNRQSAMDATFLVASYRPRELRRMTTFGNLAGSSLRTILPDGLIQIDAVSSGRAYATVFQRMREDAKHHGAFSGLGFALSYGGFAGGLVLLMALGLVLRALVSRSLKLRSPARLALAAWCVYELAFHYFELGNLDELVASAVTEAVMMFTLIWIVHKFHSDTTGSNSRMAVVTDLPAHHT